MFKFSYRLAGITALLLVLIPSVYAAPNKEVTVINETSDPVPVEVQGSVQVQGEVSSQQRLPISKSGEWQGAGLNIAPMIIHDLVFYNSDFSANDPCKIGISYVIDQFSSRRLYYVELERNESADFHFEAGIDSTDLRFGTITSIGDDPNGCIINWAAMGFEIE